MRFYYCILRSQFARSFQFWELLHSLYSKFGNVGLKDKTVLAEAGREHVQIGKILAVTVVGIVLLALANEIGNALIASLDGIKMGFIVLMFVTTTAVLVCLY
jgi:hypothetical protein